MFDIGWAELLVIATVLIVVVGPKDLPGMLRAFGRTMSKVRGMAAEFRGQFDDALREAELDEVRKAVDDVRGLSPRSALSKATHPFREAGEDVRKALDEATDEADDDEPFDSAVEFDAPHEMEPLDPPDLSRERAEVKAALDAKARSGSEAASRASSAGADAGEAAGTGGEKRAGAAKPPAAKAPRSGSGGAKPRTTKSAAAGKANSAKPPAAKSSVAKSSAAKSPARTRRASPSKVADSAPKTTPRKRAGKAAKTDETAT